jgi:hypothetical protein
MDYARRVDWLHSRVGVSIGIWKEEVSMTRIIGIPMVVGIMTLILCLVAFNPMVALLEAVGVSWVMARVAVAIMIIIPAMFIFGFNSGKKVFFWLVGLLLLVLALGFFLL